MKTLAVTVCFGCLVLLASGCNRQQEFVAPNMVDKNEVRPDVIIEPIEPLPPGTTN
jgi:hypothetical protein